jgi:RNA polymerase sigma-70 factor (ECF subfamily)
MAVSSDPLGEITQSLEPSRWLDDHGDYLLACALHFVRDTDKAEDLVQDTLLAALKGVAQFEGRSSVRTWLVSIMKHRAIDQLRQAGRRNTLGRKPLTDLELDRWSTKQFLQSGKWAEPGSHWGAGATGSLASQEFQRALGDCLSQMPPRSAEALRLADQNELTLEQVSKVLQISASNVGVILHRTRLAMRHCLEKKWFGAKPGERR